MTAEGAKQSEILRAEGDARAEVVRAEGEATAIATVFEAIHTNDPDPKLLAYQYLQSLPAIANGASNKVWILPAELTQAMANLSQAFTPNSSDEPRAPSALVHRHQGACTSGTGSSKRRAICPATFATIRTYQSAWL